jgi:hypothetical protein
VEYIRAYRATRRALVISDPQPVGSTQNLWVSAGQGANIGIFLLLLGGFLYVGREILLPILIAAVVAMTLAPLIKAGQRRGISPSRRLPLLRRSAGGSRAGQRLARPSSKGCRS